MDAEAIVKNVVHCEYYEHDTNCATTTLICLGKLLNFEIDKQLIFASIGLYGAGGYRAQCGLVEGGLMSIGIVGTSYGLSKQKIVDKCYEFAKIFEQKFSSLQCRELRPGGFRSDDPPHLCENLTLKACLFSYMFIINNVIK